jgi:hypothetical protein
MQMIFFKKKLWKVQMVLPVLIVFVLCDFFIYLSLEFIHYYLFYVNSNKQVFLPVYILYASKFHFTCYCLIGNECPGCTY